MSLRRVIAGGVAATACVLPVAGAQAAPPVLVERVTFDRVFEHMPECPDFTTTGTFTIDRTIRRFVDQDGNVTRETWHIAFVGTTTNDRTGTTLPMSGRRVITDDFEAGTATETGVLRRVTAPGEGIVLHDSGRRVTDLVTGAVRFEAGWHEFWDGARDAYCAALA